MAVNIAIVGKNSYIGTSFEKYLEQFGDQYNIKTIDAVTTSPQDMDFNGIDVVLHLAGIVHKKEKRNMADLYHRVNAILPFETAKKAKDQGVKQFIFLSSMSVYGEEGRLSEKVVIKKDTQPNPRSLYGKSKLEGENFLNQLNDENFHIAILRPPMVYGPNCKGNFPRLVKLALKLPVFPNIKNQRSMIYIDNLCEFFRIIIDNKSAGIFLPQNSEYVSTIDIVKTVREFYGKKTRLTKIFNPLIKLMSHFIGAINKVFGSKIYCNDLDLGYNYNLVIKKDSILKSLIK